MSPAGSGSARGREWARLVPPAHSQFVGTAGQIADQWVHYVRTRAADGFNLLSHLVPSALADVVGKLVPELQERSAYEGSTLREHLAQPGLARGEG